MCPVIRIGMLNLTGYWLMTMVGLVFCFTYLVVANRSGRFTPIERNHLFNICCIGILSVFVGGKLMQIVVNLPGIVQKWPYYKGRPDVLFADLTRGRAFYGGALLLIVLFALYVRKYHLPVNTLCAICTPGIALFMVFGRLGCFMGGCCYGVSVPWGVVFPENSLAPGGIPLFPSQLVEAACHFILFIVLAVVERRLERKWKLVSLYLGCYAVIRFVLEFWRGDAARGGWILSSSQWVSVVLFCVVCTHYVLVSHRRPETVT